MQLLRRNKFIMYVLLADGCIVMQRFGRSCGHCWTCALSCRHIFLRTTLINDWSLTSCKVVAPGAHFKCFGAATALAGATPRCPADKMIIEVQLDDIMQLPLPQTVMGRRTLQRTAGHAPASRWKWQSRSNRKRLV